MPIGFRMGQLMAGAAAIRGHSSTGPMSPTPQRTSIACAVRLQHRISNTSLTTEAVSIIKEKPCGSIGAPDMYRRLAFLSLPLLLAYAPIDDALAARQSNGQSRNIQQRSGHATSSRHHARGADRDGGSYRSQLLRNKSEWRQAQHRTHSTITTSPSM
jgi:hypothetical protein